MDGACGTYWRERYTCRFLVRKPEGREILERNIVGGKLI
jgi:hypothetical protein